MSFIEPILRLATINDLKVVSTWLRNSEECDIWSGGVVPFPIELEGLRDRLGMTDENTWVLVGGHLASDSGSGQRHEHERGHERRLGQGHEPKIDPSMNQQEVPPSKNVLAIGQLLQKPDNRLHLARILVHPAMRGYGLGRSLVTRLLEQGLSFKPRLYSLNVHFGNVAAIRLYHSLGFNPVNNLAESKNGKFQYMELPVEKDALTM